MRSPPSTRIARGGEGLGVGGLSAGTATSVNAELPPTPDPSPPLRGGREKINLLLRSKRLEAWAATHQPRTVSTSR